MSELNNKPSSYTNSISRLLAGLQEIQTSKDDPRYEKVIGWMKDLPPPYRSDALYEAIGRAFSTTKDGVRLAVDPKVDIPDFERLVPSKGWLRTYVDYTRMSEPPTVFHFFVGVVVLGASLKRNLHWEKGTGNIFPNMSVILVGDSGVVKKTTACDFGCKLLRSIGCTVLADKITPEALLDTFVTEESATGLIYAPELKAFLGSQKYMEGMIPMLTRLFDSPDEYRVKTMGRDGTLTNVGLCMLGGTTMDWLKALPPDSFGGGFMSRHLLVVQNTTDRCFPFPPVPPDHLRTKLISRMADLSHVRAKLQFTPNAIKWYENWYRDRSKRIIEDKMFSGYYARKPDHLVRLAMILSVSEDDSFVVEVRHLEHSLKILDWTERWLPGAFEQLNVTPIGEDHVRLLRQIKAAGGQIKHSDWLRKNSSRGMTATSFKQHITTMREAKLVDMDGGTYILTPEGWRR